MGLLYFFQLNPFRKLNELRPSQIFLVGIMMGSFQIGTEMQVVETNNKAFSLQNIGIATVVPSYKLNEILFTKELKERREGAKAKSEKSETTKK